MYEINLPREFVAPPLYLLRSESKPKVLAKRLGLAFRPTLRQDVQIGYARQPGGGGITVAMKPAGEAAVAPAGAGAPLGLVMGRPVTRISDALPPARKAMAMPNRAVRAGEPVVKIYRYAPMGGFMRSFARTGNEAIRTRPRGVIKFT